jgi:hypothetical protein
MLDIHSSSTSSSDDGSDLSSRHRSAKWPSNVRVLGVFLDAEHVGVVSERIRHIANEQCCELLSLWRAQVQRFPFCVIAGQLERHDAGVVGGLAADWKEALYLHAYAKARLDWIAQRATSFSSVWGLHLTEARRNDVLAITAAAQTVAGHA